MAGLISQLFDKALEKAMSNVQEKIWPMVKYLIDRAILIPVLGIGAILAGYYLTKANEVAYLTGDGGMYGIVAICVVVAISRIFNKRGPQ